MDHPTYRADNFEQAQSLEAWEKFIETGEISPLVPPVIANSWRRCRARFNPLQEIIFVRLKKDYLLSSQVVSFDLISVARPIMEDIYQSMEKSGIFMILVNGAGCILDFLGDGELSNLFHQWGIEAGVIMTEEQIGTNSLGLALKERVAVEVVGTQHYAQQFHQLAGAAAPIFDLRGHLLGVLSVITRLENHYPYPLGLVTAGARAIEGQRQSDLLMAEQNSQLAQLNTILSGISDGIIVWNAHHVLMHINRVASQILGVPAQSLVGKPVNYMFEMSPLVEEAVEQYKPLIDVEITINIENRNIACLISLDFVLNNGQLQWIIMTLRPEKQIRKLVTRQVGASAVLTLNDIAGESPQIQRVRDFVKSAAKAQANILIRGEVGTGKNALANAIHNSGSRRDGPFVIFGCSSIPNELVVRELLGFEELGGGRQTGNRPSKFELAQGGALFFQDVDALPLEAQAVLLNALEIGLVQRIGSSRLIRIDVRVIASTSAPIEKLIAQGSFRADLFYRLSVFSVTLPPLRDRPQDIPLVVDRILKRLSKQWETNRLELGPGVIEELKRRPWQGNIREVEAVLGRAAAQAGPNGVISLDLLPASIRFPGGALEGEQFSTQILSMMDIERNAIVQTARMYRGNLTLMSQALAISRTTLWRRLKEYSIQPKDYR